MDVPAHQYTYLPADEELDPDHRFILKDALKFLAHLPRGAAILDAGCGGGDVAEALAEHGFAVHGLDLSPTGIAMAKGRGCGEFRQASLYEDLAAPFGRTSFDAILAIEVIEHLYSPKTFVERVREALPPGGVVVISTPYWGYWKNLMLAATNRTDRSLTALWEGGHIKHFSRRTLTRLMTEGGFETLGFHGYTVARINLPYLWSGMVMGFRVPA
jgi:2-polyprenyl-6-hydroxyphenyl methylase/3-demethylubiquinone-9 3-methyltransferase